MQALRYLKPKQERAFQDVTGNGMLAEATSFDQTVGGQPSVWTPLTLGVLGPWRRH